MVRHLEAQPGALWQLRSVNDSRRMLELNLSIGDNVHLVEVSVMTDTAGDDFVRVRIPVSSWSEQMALWVVHCAGNDLMASFGAYALRDQAVGFQWIAKADQTHVGSVDVHIIELGSVAQGHIDFAKMGS